MAVPPSSVASRDASPPPSFPIGVRAAPRMTVWGIGSPFRGVNAPVEGRLPPMLPPGKVPPMRIAATTDGPLATDADTIVVGVFEGEDVAHDVEDATLQRLLDRGEARRAFKRLAVTHAAERRWIVVGL